MGGKLFFDYNIADMFLNQRRQHAALYLAGYFRYSYLLVTDGEAHSEFSDGPRVGFTQHRDSIVVCYHTSWYHPRSGVLVRCSLLGQPVS